MKEFDLDIDEWDWELIQFLSDNFNVNWTLPKSENFDYSHGNLTKLVSGPKINLSSEDTLDFIERCNNSGYDVTFKNDDSVHIEL